ncbi:MAG TPA: DUF6498-containing protein [Candidatus Limnocylindria bacterium]|nr:DUF6498-containing protein [Candidatus Limnocylindria bacterium]
MAPTQPDVRPPSLTPLGRAFALYRQTALSRSAIVLLVANLIPLVGVLLFGWSLLTILVLSWLENGIVGIWNVPKIALAQKSMVTIPAEMPNAAARVATATPAQAAALRTAWAQARAAQAAQAAANPAAGRLAAVGRTGLAIFFAFHYGMFFLVHGIFVFALPMFLAGSSEAITCVAVDPRFPGYEVCEAANPFGEVLWGSVAIAAVVLLISHGASFFLNYIGRGEYLTASAGSQMAAPYARVVVLHLTIIFGSFFVAFLGSPIGALLVLVVLKTAFDLGLHLRERRSADRRIPAGTALGQVVRST